MTAIARGTVARSWMFRHLRFIRHRGRSTLAITVAERQYAAVARPGRLSAALTRPATACFLRPSSRRMRAVPAQDGSSDVLLAAPPKGSLRARWAGPQLAGPRRASTDVRTDHRAPLTRRQAPAGGGGIRRAGPGSGAGGPVIKRRGRASRPRHRVADVEHPFPGLHQL
jgi:hypothetical protein